MDVKLKNFLGMKPGKYLFILYSILIAAILFFLLVYPGLKNSGSVVVFSSDPELTSVWSDTTYVGATPCKAFFPKGSYTITFKKNGFETKEVSIQVKGRIFFSRFIPRKLKVDAQLALTQPDAIIQNAYTEFATYGLINSFSERYQPQPVLTEAVKDLAKYQDKAKVEAFLLEALKNAYNDYLLKDFINAYSLLKDGKLPAQDDNALAAAAARLLSGRGDALCHICACPGKIGEAAAQGAGTKQPALAAKVSPKAGDLTVLDMHFTEVSAGTYLLGHQGQNGAFNEADPSPYTKEITKVYISEQITIDQYEQFVKENPQWEIKPEYSLQSADKVHVSNVSWSAAQAYCQYLTDRLPADLKAKYSFRLPTEYEWEAYAQGGKESPQTLWDWCQNWYAPAETFYKDNVPETFTGAEKAVRGGGRQAWVRGCQSPDWATPFLGFRIVLSEK
ncbi:MAG: SUMF1/EgtB/PvdO family nonheme iron enzyme [Spirochaetia bacterium]|nr:SUMF1/EgtB/PvdO family nonheme iron enzyme [Spirochaetia bacterium]